ncbi:hypothetical protein KBZ10_19515 [Streptomyces sp. F63]|uniref:hypothetical protein n=1 Tax=Streptomyces sp. F63 TaxID=2824887 RepID=UPI001B381735|nr:hypothetical protein [Streptomyces sp. F63]MBQ0986657.1 hypothetical protein [Streptomyces sp. F63]
MNTVASRIGRSLALVLPVVLVLSGTLAVTRVAWSTSEPESVLAASSARASSAAAPRAAHELLRDRLVAELRERDPGVALTTLQEEVNRRPSLAAHCVSLARALGRAAVAKYGPRGAQKFSRPVCDTAFASGVAQQAHRGR